MYLLFDFWENKLKEAYLHHPSNIFHIVDMLIHVQITTFWLQRKLEQRKKKSNKQYEQTKDAWNKAGDS